MDDLSYVQLRLMADGKDKWPVVASKTGISVHTIIKVARQQTKNPRFYTIAPLTQYYRARDKA